MEYKVLNCILVNLEKNINRMAKDGWMLSHLCSFEVGGFAVVFIKANLQDYPSVSSLG